MIICIKKEGLDKDSHLYYTVIFKMNSKLKKTFFNILYNQANISNYQYNACHCTKH